MPSYQYEPLQPGHIRLLTLHPGKGNDPIRLSITHQLFPDNDHTCSSISPYFEALSYCWGGSEDATMIYITPKTRKRLDFKWLRAIRTKTSAGSGSSSISAAQSSTLKIRSNLASALLHLRVGDSPRVLWTDAICINQSDVSEKSLQVRRMGNIYRYAWRVVVWLGPESDNSDHAVQTLSHLAQQAFLNPATREVHNNPHCDSGCEEWFRSTYRLPYKDATWEAIGDMLSCGWFGRVWIWQEIGLAQQTTAILQYGQSTIRWTDFKNAIACLYEKKYGTMHPGLAVLPMSTRLEAAYRLAVLSSSDKMLTLLQDMRGHTSCEKAKDRIYAILNLAQDGSDLHIVPDYEEEDLEVYRNFPIANSRVHQSLTFLVTCDIQSWKHGPTWIPDWSEPLSCSGYPLSEYASSYVGWSEFIDHDVCRAHAVFCGTVKRCSDTIPDNLNVSILSNILGSWINHARDINSSTDAKSLGVLLQALLQALTDNEDYMGSDLPLEVYARTATQLCTKSEATSAFSSFLSNLNSKIPFTTHTSLISRGRRLYQTENGNVGLGPPAAQAGDLVYSIIGCSGLMVLRRNTGGTQYSVIGSCNLNGHAYMEAQLGPLPDNYHGKVRWRQHASELLFVDSQTGTESRFDPRLSEEVAGWRSDEQDDEGRVIWENLDSGERTFHDPRHSDIAFLKRRGVKIETIDLI